MRLFAALFALLLVSPAAYAIDWKSIGQSLPDDTTSMRDRYVYFDSNATDKNVALDVPVLIASDIEQWLPQRIADVMNLDGPKYDQQVAVNKRHFTDKGYAEYVASLEAAQLPKLLKEQRYTMSAIVTDPPNIFAKGLRDENKGQGDKKLVHVWQTETPVYLNYKDAKGATNNYKVYLVAELVRIPMKEDNTLVAINSWQFNAKARKITPKAP